MTASPPRLRLGRLPGVVSSCFGVSRVEGAWPERKSRNSPLLDDQAKSVHRLGRQTALQTHLTAASVISFWRAVSGAVRTYLRGENGESENTF